MNTGDWKTIDSEDILSNKWLTITRDKIITPGGEEGEYYIYRSKPAVYIIAYEDDSIYFIKQYRYPIKDWILEIPAGSIENNDSLETAKKELFEETNISAASWEDLGEYYALPGVADKKFTLFLATQLTVSDESLENIESNENITKRNKYSIRQIKEMIKNNEILDIPTIACINIFFQKKDL